MTEEIVATEPKDSAKCAAPSHETVMTVCEAVRDIIRAEWRGFWSCEDLVEELPDVFSRAYDKLSAKN